ncbi:hypothetical protein [Pseudomonas sp. LT1P18]|uniref:hypothetical protein n=1 Tax=Pseudomonas arabinosi TaxID=3398357 RepID=UPI0039F09847
MSVNPIESGTTVSNVQEAEFNTALDNASVRAAAAAEESGEVSDDFMDQLIGQAVVMGGQFIVMPLAQNLLKEAQEDDE